MMCDDGSNPEFWDALLNDRDTKVQGTWAKDRVAENLKEETHRQFAKS